MSRVDHDPFRIERDRPGLIDDSPGREIKVLSRASCNRTAIQNGARSTSRCRTSVGGGATTARRRARSMRASPRDRVGRRRLLRRQDRRRFRRRRAARSRNACSVCAARTYFKIGSANRSLWSERRFARLSRAQASARRGEVPVSSLGPRCTCGYGLGPRCGRSR